MLAAYIESFGPIRKVQVGDLPKPTMEENEVLIKVGCAGVNPVDWKIVEGLLKTRLPFKFPLILGWEAAGTVESLGKNVSSLKVGDEVYLYCRKPTMQWGSFAEYLTYPAEHVALKPKNLSMLEAAVVPLAGLTAWQALFDKVHLKAGETVLIHAGGGGVGGFAIQWAKIKGARVITTTSQAKFDYVKQFGADVLIDYHSKDFVKELQGSKVDVVLDPLGGETYRKSFDVLKRGGRIVSLLEQPNPVLDIQYGVKSEYIFMSPSQKNLQEIGHLFESGKAKTPQIKEYPLKEVREALEEVKKGHMTGKIALRIS